MGRLFGTDGIRSVANRWPLTPDFVLRLGKATAQVITREEGTNPKVLIGRDPRHSGHLLESALAAGLMSQGIDVLRAGVIPTPGVAYLTRKHRARLGVVISASHNPFHDNGIKIFGSEGFKIPDEMEIEIERLSLDRDNALEGADARGLGRSEDVSDWSQDYIDHLVGVWGKDRSLEGKRIVLDCANGATSEIAPKVFHRLGMDVIAMENEPDGFNINEHYENTRPESLRATVLSEHAIAGVAFDGDGDRAIMVDDKGGFLNGDAMLAILARDMKQKGWLSNAAVVGTPMSNWGLKASLEEVGIRLEETSVGDRFVLQRMIEENYSLGGEQSGHIIVLRQGQTTGDGIYTALAMLKAVMDDAKQSLSALTACIREFPEYLVSIKVPDKPPLQLIPEVQAALQRLHESLGDNIDITLRYSGTEPKLRLNIRAGEEYEQETLVRAAEAFMAVCKRVIK